MKKHAIATAAVISCLALAGCGNDTPKTASETELTTESITQTEAVKQTETEAITVTTTTPPTEAQDEIMEITMDNIDEIFSLDITSKENYEEYNPLFLYCQYSKPEEMDLRTVLYHGIGDEYNYSINEIDEEELLASGLNIEGVNSVGAVKIEKDKLNEYLVKKTGLTIDEFENADMKYTYVSDYDAYYGYRATDTIIQPIDFSSVEMEDGIYSAVYTTYDLATFSQITCRVKFKVNDGILQFISNEKI